MSALDPRERRLSDLLRSYAKLVRMAVRRVGGSRAGDTEEVEQAFLVNLSRQALSERTIEHPASYVYKAAVRETVRAVRKMGPPVAADAPGPGRVAADAERVRLLRDAIAALQPDRARAVRARLHGLSPAEITALYAWRDQRTRRLIERGMADLETGLRMRGRR